MSQTGVELGIATLRFLNFYKYHIGGIFSSGCWITSDLSGIVHKVGQENQMNHNTEEIRTST